MQQNPAESTAAPAASATPMGEEYRGLPGGDVAAPSMPAAVSKLSIVRPVFLILYKVPGVRSVPSWAPGSSSTTNSMTTEHSTHPPSFMLCIPSFMAADFSTDGTDMNRLFSMISTGLDFNEVAWKEFSLG